MSHRIRTLAAVVATLSASLLATSPAHAEDHQTCVSKAEYFGGFDYGIIQGDLEARWEVQRLGWEQWTPVGNVTAYPRCGFSPDSGVWYGVAYNHAGRSVARVWPNLGTTYR